METFICTLISSLCFRSTTLLKVKSFSNSRTVAPNSMILSTITIYGFSTPIPLIGNKYTSERTSAATHQSTLPLLFISAPKTSIRTSIFILCESATMELIIDKIAFVHKLLPNEFAISMPSIHVPFAFVDRSIRVGVSALSMALSINKVPLVNFFKRSPWTEHKRTLTLNATLMKITNVAISIIVPKRTLSMSLVLNPTPAVSVPQRFVFHLSLTVDFIVYKIPCIFVPRRKDVSSLPMTFSISEHSCVQGSVCISENTHSLEPSNDK
mmetsp:Transcript_10928/g.20228  ORF Transcript_10928/g.20228 Transcript_10928/m.20228 type:complete len:268 (-) Transcript_10928:2126-2929(-)